MWCFLEIKWKHLLLHEEMIHSPLLLKTLIDFLANNQLTIFILNSTGIFNSFTGILWFFFKIQLLYFSLVGKVIEPQENFFKPCLSIKKKFWFLNWDARNAVPSLEVTLVMVVWASCFFMETECLDTRLAYSLHFFHLCGTTEQLPECRHTSRLLSELGKVGSSGRLGL